MNSLKCVLVLSCVFCSYIATSLTKKLSEPNSKKHKVTDNNTKCRKVEKAALKNVFDKGLNGPLECLKKMVGNSEKFKEAKEKRNELIGLWKHYDRKMNNKKITLKKRIKIILPSLVNKIKSYYTFLKEINKEVLVCITGFKKTIGHSWSSYIEVLFSCEKVGKKG